jgi:hypothetical protein
MSNLEYPGTRRAVFFVRNDLPAPSAQRRAELEQTLQDLVCAGVLDDVETVVWNKRVRADSAQDTAERNRYSEFADWARRARVSLAPFFDTRECYSTTTGEKETQLVLPTMALAVYEDDELVRVAPHANAGSTESVTDCVELLSTHADSIPSFPSYVSMAE